MVKWSRRFNIRRRVGFGPRGATSAAGAVARAVASKLARSSTRTQTQKSAASSMPVTNQRDFKTDYARRRLTKWQRKRRWISRKRNRRIVNLVRGANVGSTHIVRRSLGLVSTSSSVSGYVSYGLYGLNGTSFDTVNTCNDIGEFFKEMDPASWASVNQPLVQGLNHKIYTFHATAEYTIRNNSESQVAIVEAYFIRGKRRMPQAYVHNPTDLYVNGFNRQTIAFDPNTGNLFDGQLAANQIGVTPFQNALFCRHLTITRRQKFIIAPGDEVSFVIKDGRRRVFTMDSTRSYSFDNNYIGVLFQQQGAPDAAGGVETPAAPSVLTYMCVRRYRLKMFPDNLPRDAFETTDP